MSIESKSDYKETPRGRYDYWSDEIKAAEKTAKSWKDKGDKIVQRYLGKQSNEISHSSNNNFNLNLFHSNVTTLGSMLYGNTPKIDVSRRYAQPDDDIGRVAAEMMERLLNLDVEENGAEIDAVLRATLQDRLLPGLGCARVRYEFETGVVDGMEQMIKESAPIEYLFWGDVLWGWSRTWAEVPWVAFRNFLTKDEIRDRFGGDAADNIQLKKQKMQTGEEGHENDENDSIWMKGEIWEIWCKKTKTVHWISIGYDKQLEEKEDPLKLSGFFPVPPFFIANVTTALFTPKADFTLSQDLYNEIDRLQTRIAILTEAVKAVGVYDAGADGVQRMFKEGFDNDLIPIENWGLFSEKGGISGTVDWLPLQDIVNALDKLVMLRDQTIGLLQQTTGMADIMRGDLGNSYEGVGQTEMKAKFGSVRVQALQDQFAQFASDLMQVKAEVIARHFDPQTIFDQSNMGASPDAEMAQEAIELIKNPEQARIRIDIRPESVAMVDYAQLKNERTDYINALSMFLQSASPLMESEPTSKPFLLELLAWGLAGFKGASEIEGVIDRAIDAVKKEGEQGEKPDPAQEAEQQAEQMKQQGELAKIQAKAQADMQLREQDLQADIQTLQAQHQAKLEEVQAAMQSKLAEIEAKLTADLAVEQAQTAMNTQQQQAQVAGEIQKDVVSTQLEMQKNVGQTQLKIQEISATNAAKILETGATAAANKIVAESKSSE